MERTPGLDLVTATGGVQLAWADEREALGRRILDRLLQACREYRRVRTQASPDQLALAAVGDS